MSNQRRVPWRGISIDSEQVRSVDQEDACDGDTSNDIERQDSRLRGRGLRALVHLAGGCIRYVTYDTWARRTIDVFGISLNGSIPSSRWTFQASVGDDQRHGSEVIVGPGILEISARPRAVGPELGSRPPQGRSGISLQALDYA